jgi:RNA polymerase primary sigma factor
MMEGASSEEASDEVQEADDGRLDAAGSADLVRGHLRLVSLIGRQFANRGVDLPDLLQEGSIGLIKAALRFDRRQGVQFATYATWWIRQRMGRAVVEQGRTVRIPGHVNATLREIAQTAHQLTGRLGRPPAPSEIAKRMELPIARIEHILGTRTRQVSLDAPSDPDGGGRGGGDLRLLDVMPDQRAEASPQDAVEARAMVRQMRRALETLRPREQDVLRMRFGIDDEPRSLREVAIRMNLQLHHVRQIERRAMKKLRHDLALRDLHDD